MTSVTERIAQITARAQREGRTAIATPPKPRPVSLQIVQRPPELSSPASEPRQPPSPSDALLYRPLLEVMCRIDNAADYRKECRQRCAAWLIAKALGPDWRKTVEEDRSWHGVFLQHVSGLRLRLSHDWNKPNRFVITFADSYQKLAGLPESITVSATRSPAAIASDIQRRLIDTGAHEAHRQTIDGRAKRRRDEVAERLAILRIARAAGDSHCAARETVHHGHPETNRIPFNGVGTFHAAHGYGFHGGAIELSINCHPEVAERIAALMVEMGIQWKAQQSPGNGD